MIKVYISPDNRSFPFRGRIVQVVKGRITTDRADLIKVLDNAVNYKEVPAEQLEKEAKEKIARAKARKQPANPVAAALLAGADPEIIDEQQKSVPIKTGMATTATTGGVDLSALAALRAKQS